MQRREKNREITQYKRKQQKYLTEQSQQDAGTTFEVRASIVNIGRNFGEKESLYFLCGREETKKRLSNADELGIDWIKTYMQILPKNLE